MKKSSKKIPLKRIYFSSRLCPQISTSSKVILDKKMKSKDRRNLKHLIDE